MGNIGAKLSMDRWLRKVTHWPGQVKKWTRPPVKARRNFEGMHTLFKQVARVGPRRWGPRVRRIEGVTDAAP